MKRFGAWPIQSNGQQVTSVSIACPSLLRTRTAEGFTISVETTS